MYLFPSITTFTSSVSLVTLSSFAISFAIFSIIAQSPLIFSIGASVGSVCVGGVTVLSPYSSFNLLANSSKYSCSFFTASSVL